MMKKFSNTIRKIPRYYFHLLLVLICFSFLFILFFSNSKEKVIFDKITFLCTESSLDVNVEYAKTPQEKAQGLMFRKHLEENSGMLFIYENNSYLNFWMKNTLISLDIIFINSSNEIVNIEEAEPCKTENCKIYTSIRPAKYVLEVNKGFSKNNKIKDCKFIFS